MRIDTRYSLGDTVWGIHRWKRRKAIACPLCNGAGQVTIGGTDRSTSCPDCFGRGSVTTEEQQTLASIEKLTIGQVRAEVQGEVTVTYMAFETGVGSGRIWSESALHPSREDAEQACADMGAVLEAVSA